jgi:hypothetical protein
MMQPKKRAKKPGMPITGKPGEPRYTIMPVGRTIGPRFVAEDVKPVVNPVNPNVVGKRVRGQGTAARAAATQRRIEKAADVYSTTKGNTGRARKGGPQMSAEQVAKRRQQYIDNQAKMAERRSRRTKKTKPKYVADPRYKG